MKHEFLTPVDAAFGFGVQDWEDCCRKAWSAIGKIGLKVVITLEQRGVIKNI